MPCGVEAGMQNFLRYVLFDFDCTLVDSSESILYGMQKALDDVGVAPIKPLDKNLIGPPLLETLAGLSGVEDPQILTQLAESFKAHYDAEGYKVTGAYPGVECMLLGLVERSVPMAIATNKRVKPTMKILEHLGWLDFFSAVGALDGPGGIQPHKTALIKSLITKLDVNRQVAIYIGDNWEDGLAADANGLRFVAAGWGYGDWTGERPANWQLQNSPEDLSAFLQNML